MTPDELRTDAIASLRLIGVRSAELEAEQPGTDWMPPSTVRMLDRQARWWAHTAETAEPDAAAHALQALVQLRDTLRSLQAL